jgi:hypothetical protein
MGKCIGIQPLEGLWRGKKGNIIMDLKEHIVRM